MPKTIIPPAPKKPDPVPYNLASFINAHDDVTGAKLVPAHIESFSAQGKYTKIDMSSGKTWYVEISPEEVDQAIKLWYTRVSV